MDIEELVQIMDEGRVVVDCTAGCGECRTVEPDGDYRCPCGEGRLVSPLIVEGFI